MVETDISTGQMIRFATWLAPSLPEAMFSALAQDVGCQVGLPTTLQVITDRSGPLAQGPEPFGSGEVDVGFLCAPTWSWLARREPPPAQLAGVAPVFDDPRNLGRPTYFSEVVVHRESGVDSFELLRGRRFAYNDQCSLSGWFSLLGRIHECAEPDAFMGSTYHSGSHLASLEAVASRRADAAVIDSNALRYALSSSVVREATRASEVRVIESLGPFPVQPVVFRSGLDATLAQSIVSALMTCHQRVDLAPFGLSHFAPVDSELTGAFGSLNALSR